jgi:outer membrane immunogenic protein
MKRFTLTLTLLSALCAFVYAGPEQYSSGKEMKQVVPLAPPPCPTWTGFYIGGFGGYKYGNIDVDLHLSDQFESEFDGLRNEFESAVSKDFNTSGAEAGGLIGFNYVWHNWLFGAEAAGGYLWLRDSRSQEFSDEVVFTASESVKTHYLFTFGPRIGYTFCRWMPYVTGGLAVGDIELDQNVREVGEQFDFRQGGSESETNVGWFVGGGLEYALTNHWRLRGQYEYIDLGSVDFHSTLSFDRERLNDFDGHHNADLTEHNVSFAVIYGF